LKIYASKKSLKRHESVVCIQRFECDKCDKNYSNKYNLKYHQCDILDGIQSEPNQLNNIPNELNNIVPNNIEALIKNIPDKQVNININTNIYNNSNNQEITNSNNKIGNKKMINKVNFLESQPKWLNFGYDEDKYKDYSKYNEDFDEKMADMYMYEEDQFKEKYKEEIVLFEKKTLELEGFKILHTELQKDSKYQNVRIKKSKSGKCYIYNGKWEEIPLQKAITKICSKLCNSLYDKETSVNQFLNLVIGSQPRRMTDLRKHIEQNIMDLNKIPLLKNEIKEINHA